MKIFAALAATTLAMAISASATTVQFSCNVTSSGDLTAVNTGTAGVNGSLSNTGASIANGITSPGTINAFTCGSLDVGAGNIITSESLFYTGDYTGGTFGTTSGTSVVETLTNNGSTPFGTISQTLTISGGNSSNSDTPTTPINLGTITPGTEASTAFSLAIASTNPTGPSAPVASSSAQVVISYTYSSTTGTPEPVSMLLFGSGLLGLSLIGRKKFARK